MQDITNKKPDYNFLNQVIENVKNIDQKSVLDVVREIYEATYYRYALLFHKAEADRERMKEVVVTKTQKIEELTALSAALLAIAESGEKIEGELLAKFKETYEKNKEDAIAS